VEVTSRDIVGMAIRELGPELPEGCLDALVARNGSVQVPSADFTIEEGDRITVIGGRDAVREAMQFVNPG
jgi:Trk K+ transport system NAD-binding subunit